MENYTKAVYVISVAAELAGVHPQTLRIYERKGLVAPARTSGGSRRYSEADIDRLNRIAELTESGLNLAGVNTVLALEKRLAELTEALRQRDRHIEELQTEAARAVRNAHQQHRRDLVPLRQKLSLYNRKRIF
ncbi:MAG: heat shock protein transcriptional repressor HspR [Acidimicrobiales bacterium]